MCRNIPRLEASPPGFGTLLSLTQKLSRKRVSLTAAECLVLQDITMKLVALLVLHMKPPTVESPNTFVQEAKLIVDLCDEVNAPTQLEHLFYQIDAQLQVLEEPRKKTACRALILPLFSHVKTVRLKSTVFCASTADEVFQPLYALFPLALQYGTFSAEDTTYSRMMYPFRMGDVVACLPRMGNIQVLKSR